MSVKGDTILPMGLAIITSRSYMVNLILQEMLILHCFTPLPKAMVYPSPQVPVILTSYPCSYGAQCIKTSQLCQEFALQCFQTTSSGVRKKSRGIKDTWFYSILVGGVPLNKTHFQFPRGVPYSEFHCNFNLQNKTDNDWCGRGIRKHL